MSSVSCIYIMYHNIVQETWTKDTPLWPVGMAFVLDSATICVELKGLVQLVKKKKQKKLIPRCSMYGIFTYIWVIFGVNVGKYSIHGAFGIVCLSETWSKWSNLLVVLFVLFFFHLLFVLLLLLFFLVLFLAIFVIFLFLRQACPALLQCLPVECGFSMF